MKKFLVILVLVSVFIPIIAIEPEKENIQTLNVGLSKDTMEAVAVLANKLGVTIDKVYPMYVKKIIYETKIKMKIMWIILIVSFLFFILFMVLSFDNTDDRDIRNVCAGVSFSIFILILIISAFCIVTLYTNLNNPEVAAINEIIKTIRGGL